eukprot:935445_1
MRVSFCVNLTEFISDGEMIQNTLYALHMDQVECGMTSDMLQDALQEAQQSFPTLLKNSEDILYRKTYEEVPLVAGRWQDIVPSEAMPDEVRYCAIRGAQYVYG